jgi:superfamily II DNA or RNA helicase
MTATPKQSRSGLANAQESIQELLDASAGSTKSTTLTNLQQYETPRWLARLCQSLLPTVPMVSVDPQCATGNLLDGASRYTFGFEIDNKHATENRTRITGNCVKAWEVLDDIYPDIRFECQVANPPFGLQWKTPDGPMDSTEYTWRKLKERTAWNGFGFMIANHKTIEKYGWHEEDDVYLYLKFPAGVWKDCDVEVGVIFWFNTDDWRVAGKHPVVIEEIAPFITDPARILSYDGYIQNLRSFFLSNPKRVRRASDPMESDGSMGSDYTCMYKVWVKTDEIIQEERRKIPPFNVYLREDGMLMTYLSHRFQTKRKIRRDDVIKLERIRNCHPLSLTAEKETRQLLEELVSCGIYTVQPEADKAIKHALVEVQKLSAPMMPVTKFMKVAHADEEESLVCHTSKDGFSAGGSYDVSSGAYSWSSKFTRKKIHWNEDMGQYTKEHSIEMSGLDRFISLIDDDECVHYFVAHPDCQEMKDKEESQSEKCQVHPEEELWDIFREPEVLTVAETHPDNIHKNKLSLAMIETMGSFRYYPGQIDYLARAGTKDYAVIAADVGCGKTLMAISLIQMKGPKRAMIIAPQGTMRGSDGEEQEYNASQWVSEINKFAPGLVVYEIFSYEDYERIKKRNGGELPNGVYVSYYQAMFQNKAQEAVPQTWNDVTLSDKVKVKLPELVDVDLRTKEGKAKLDEMKKSKDICDTIGNEVNGIRCIAKPCLSTLIQHEFDMVCLDEAHLCANLSANVTQMLIRMTPRFRYALTATPIPNIVSNLFSIMGWVCVPHWYKDGIRNAAWPWSRSEIHRFNKLFLSSERDFTQEKMNEDTKKGAGKVVKRSAVISSPARLLKHLAPNLAFISKKMCNPDYQDPEIIDVRVPIGEQQSELYQFFMNRERIPGSAYVRAGKQMTYLRNICADPKNFRLKEDQLALYSQEPPEVQSNMNPKTTAILELIKEIMDRNEQVVVVCSRIGQSDTVARFCEDAGLRLSRIDSTMPASQHSRQANLFKDKRTDVLIMGIKCAQGYSFPECPNLIIGSLEYSYGPFHQAKGRVDRVNSKWAARIYCILHANSVEETMFDIVATKQDAATICLHGERVPRDFKPVDMGEVLAIAVEKRILDTTSESLCESLWPEMRKEFRRPVLA